MQVPVLSTSRDPYIWSLVAGLCEPAPDRCCVGSPIAADSSPLLHLLRHRETTFSSGYVWPSAVNSDLGQVLICHPVVHGASTLRSPPPPFNNIAILEQHYLAFCCTYHTGLLLSSCASSSCLVLSGLKQHDRPTRVHPSHRRGFQRSCPERRRIASHSTPAGGNPRTDAPRLGLPGPCAFDRDPFRPC